MFYKQVLPIVLVFVLILGLLPLAGSIAKAANKVTNYRPGDSTYAVLNLYSSDDINNTAINAVYSTNIQNGEKLTQDGFLMKAHTPYAAWIVEAPSAGWYTFDPYFSIGNIGAANKDKLNVVFSVNDTRYYIGDDITGEGVGSVKVSNGDMPIDLYLDKGVNIVRVLPFSGPDYVYQRIDRGDGTVAATWLNLGSTGIDQRLTVHEAAPLVLSLDGAGTKPHFANRFALASSNDFWQVSGSTYVKDNHDTLPDADTLSQENMADLPYISYTLNAPADGWYDMTLNVSMATFSKYGNDGYVIVRVNGTNYKRWIRATDVDVSPFSDQNISVPLKKGDNTVVITCGMGMKGGTNADSYEKVGGGYAFYTRIKRVTVYGGVTASATPVDPKTVADAPLTSTKLETETFGVSTVPVDLSGVTELPTTRQLWEGEWFDKAAVPVVTFTVNAAKAGVYTVRPVYTFAAADGKSALDYAITGSVNDVCYDKARFEPMTARSLTAGYGELTLELEAGRNVIRILPVTDGNPAKTLDLDYIQIFGSVTVSGVMPQILELKSAEAEHINLLTVDGDALSGNTGTVSSCAAINGSNLNQLGWFSYTVNVPANGYYDLQTYVGGGNGKRSLVLIVDGSKYEIPVVGGRTLANNPVNLSMELTAGEHTILVSGMLGQTGQLGALTVSGGITKAATQIDPASMNVQPAVIEGGLVPGSVYVNTDCILTGIPVNTTGAQLKSNFLDNETARFLDADGNALSDTSIITTGCGVVYPNGTYYKVKEVLAEEGSRSVGADQLLALCNPVGRLFKHENALFMESSASSFTVVGELEGDVILTLSVEKKKNDLHSLFVEVDGTTCYFELTEGQQTVKIAEDLKKGSHAIRVVKGTEAYRQDMYVHALVYTGKLESAQPAARRIEFLGDSITAGSGVFFEDCGYGQTHSWFDYANMVSDAFGADYYSVANGGWRFTSTYNPSTSITTIYDDVSMHEDLGAYGFDWKPDVIVINLGTNDAIVYRSDKTNYTEDSFKENIHILLDLVRQKNPEAQILWGYGMMLTECEPWIQAAVEDYAKDDSKVHYVHLNGNTKGRGNHPDFAGQTEGAGMLVEAISDIMGWAMPTGTHATGDCGETC